MKFLTLIGVLFISACSTQIIEMAPEPTVQKFDLSDVEGDGIIAARDACPESKVGAQVDNNGCGTNTIHTFRHRLDVKFDTNSSEVKKEYFVQIEELADFMTEFPQVTVVIEGHTSIRGSAIKNKALSINRAKAVKKILIQRFAIASERINTVGYGFERLIAEGNDEASHKLNRRIVAELSSDKSFTDMKWTIYSVDNEDEQGVGDK